jgi:hypothetical protein
MSALYKQAHNYHTGTTLLEASDVLVQQHLESSQDITPTRRVQQAMSKHAASQKPTQCSNWHVSAKGCNIAKKWSAHIATTACDGRSRMRPEQEEHTHTQRVLAPANCNCLPMNAQQLELLLSSAKVFATAM